MESKLPNVDLKIQPPKKGGTGLIAKELPSMMYGFGDAKTTEITSVNLLEELVCEYIAGVTTLAVDKAVATGAARVGLPHFMYVLRNSDKKKEERVLQLLAIQEEIKKEKKRGSKIASASGKKSKPRATPKGRPTKRARTKK